MCSVHLYYKSDLEQLHYSLWRLKSFYSNSWGVQNFVIWVVAPFSLIDDRLRLKWDGTRAETRFRLSAKRTSPFKSTWASVRSTTGSRGVRISGSNAGYITFRGSVKSSGYPIHSPVSPSIHRVPSHFNWTLPVFDGSYCLPSMGSSFEKFTYQVTRCHKEDHNNKTMTLKSSYFRRRVHYFCTLKINKVYIYIYTGCPGRNVKNFGRVFLMLKYTDITQSTYIQS
jgi:hypothetical protein